MLNINSVRPTSCLVFLWSWALMSLPLFYTSRLAHHHLLFCDPPCDHMSCHDMKSSCPWLVCLYIIIIVMLFCAAYIYTDLMLMMSDNIVKRVYKNIRRIRQNWSKKGNCDSDDDNDHVACWTFWRCSRLSLSACSLVIVVALLSRASLATLHTYDEELFKRIKSGEQCKWSPSVWVLSTSPCHVAWRYVALLELSALRY